MKHFTDEDIVDAFRQDDVTRIRDVTEFLYKKSYPSIRKMVISRGLAIEDAEDIFQDTIIAFIANIQNRSYELSPGSKISTYLYKIAENQFLRRLKRLDTGRFLHRDDSSAGGIQQGDFLNELIRNETAEKLLKAMGELSEGCEKVLRYFYYEELSHKQIADKMGITYESVKVKRFRCIEALKKIMMNY